MVPETTGFQGPFIPPQTFPQTPTFLQPQPFTQPITVTVPPQIPAFHDRPVPFRPVPACQLSDGGSVFIPPDLSRHSTGDPRATSPSPIPRPYTTDLALSCSHSH